MTTELNWRFLLRFKTLDDQLFLSPYMALEVDRVGGILREVGSGPWPWPAYNVPRAGKLVKHALPCHNYETD